MDQMTTNDFLTIVVAIATVLWVIMTFMIWQMVNQNKAGHGGYCVDIRAHLEKELASNQTRPEKPRIRRSHDSFKGAVIPVRPTPSQHPYEYKTMPFIPQPRP